MNHIKLLTELLREIEELQYGDENNLDKIKRRSDMIIRKIFAENSKYLKDLKSIRFSPMISPSTPEYVKESWELGVKRLNNLVSTMIDELKIFGETGSFNIEEKKPISKKNGKRVFIVHGHDDEMKQSVARVLEKLGLDPVILHDKPNKGRTIIEKFTDYSDVDFAVVLLSPDDECLQSGADEMKSYRARQNVVFELGYFIGKLGRKSVVAIHKNTEGFEMPSDYSGVLFVPYDSSENWKFAIVKELSACGYSVDANKLLS